MEVVDTKKIKTDIRKKVTEMEITDTFQNLPYGVISVTPVITVGE